MTDYVLLPGSGGEAWYWHLVVDELARRGRTAVAVDLPAGDPSAGFTEYADAAMAAIGDASGFVLVAQSMGGFTAPLVCERTRVDLLVLVNAMVPKPGETAGGWFAATGAGAAREAAAAARGGQSLDDDPGMLETFFHDVPAAVRDEAFARGEPKQSEAIFGHRVPFERWPDVPTRFLAATDDRMFPIGFQRRVVRERLGFAPDEMPGGHLSALSRPVELADRLEAYRAEVI